MRFAASPLMVAVALGLLGPSVLEAEEEPTEARAEDAEGVPDASDAGTHGDAPSRMPQAG